MLIWLSVRLGRESKKLNSNKNGKKSRRTLYLTYASGSTMQAFITNSGLSRDLTDIIDLANVGVDWLLCFEIRGSEVDSFP